MEVVLAVLALKLWWRHCFGNGDGVLLVLVVVVW